MSFTASAHRIGSGSGLLVNSTITDYSAVGPMFNEAALYSDMGYDELNKVPTLLMPTTSKILTEPSNLKS